MTRSLWFISVLFLILVGACSPPKASLGDASRTEDQYEIITLLPKDAIPSIDNPEFYSLVEANREYEPDELVIGIDFDGEARAYSVDLLSRHEIVNDVVNRKPFAVTW